MIRTSNLPAGQIITALPDASTTVSLRLPDGLSIEEWSDVGRQLIGLDTNVKWLLGDWWAYGEFRYGDKTEHFKTPLEGVRSQDLYKRLANYGWVSGAVEISRRRENLSWSSHEAVAKLDAADQETILSRAEENGWGSHEVRAAVREFKARLSDKPETQEPPQEPPGYPAQPGDAEQPGEVNRPRHLHRATPFEVLCEAWNEAPAHVRRAFVQEYHLEIASLLAGIGGGEGLVHLTAPAPGEAPHKPGILSDIENPPDLPPSLDRGTHGES